MKTLILAVVVSLSLTGCATITNMIPSFWDDNQSAKIVDIRWTIEQVTCEPGTQLSDAEYLLSEVQWFQLYSQSKGQRQQDVIQLIKPMAETIRDWRDRSATKEGSQAYCLAKKKIMQKQAARAAESILGRF